MSKIDVHKFGGVAAGSAEAIGIAAAHVQRAAPRVAVVVSAMNGVTDLLRAASQAALRRDRDGWERAAQSFELRHADIVNTLIKSPASLLDEIANASRELRAMCESIAVLRELTPRAQDALVARGERVLARLFTAALGEAGIAATYVDATEVVITERRLGSLWPSFTACGKQARAVVAPRLDA